MHASQDQGTNGKEFIGGDCIKSSGFQHNSKQTEILYSADSPTLIQNCVQAKLKDTGMTTLPLDERTIHHLGMMILRCTHLLDHVEKCKHLPWLRYCKSSRAADDLFQ